jgi:putative tryptophan/tyrosine transport system substrate-binding protein
MTKKLFKWLLNPVSLIVVSAAHGQQAKKLPRIGYLSGSAAAAMASRTEAFQHGLRDLGYMEGKNIVV